MIGNGPFVYNHNYQPYLNGANLAKKAEFLKEFQEFCSQSPEWEQMLPVLHLDGATAHGANSEKESRELFNAFVLDCEQFKKKDTFVRSSAWYSIVEAASHHDATFQAWRFLLTHLAKELLKDPQKLQSLHQKAQKMAEESAHGSKSEGESKELRVAQESQAALTKRAPSHTACRSRTLPR